MVRDYIFCGIGLLRPSGFFSWDQEDVEVAVRRAAQPFQFRVLSGFGDATVDCCFAEIPSVRT